MINRQQKSGSMQRWCIQRTAGPRTLPLAASLIAAGFDAWAPQMTIRRRRPRSKTMTELQAAILPTFVFLSANGLDDLRRLVAMSPAAVPPFSVMSHAGRVPLISEWQMSALRAEEERAATAHKMIVDREARLAERNERQRQRAILRASAPTFEAGAKVRVTQPAFAGMTGIVERGQGTAAIVNLGGSISITSGAWILESVGVNREHLLMGAAA